MVRQPELGNKKEFGMTTLADVLSVLDVFCSAAGGPPEYYSVTSVAENSDDIDDLLTAYKDLYEIDESTFGEENQLKEKLFALAVKDPRAILIANDRKGEAVAYLSLFGLKSNRLLRELEKRNRDTLDTPDLLDYYTDIVPRDQWGTDTVHIYVDAIAIRGRAKYKGRRPYLRAPISLLTRLVVENKECSTPIGSIATVAVSEEGEALARSIINEKPKVEREGKYRVLYVKRVRSKKLSDLLLDPLKNTMRDLTKAKELYPLYYLLVKEALQWL